MRIFTLPNIIPAASETPMDFFPQDAAGWVGLLTQIGAVSAGLIAFCIKFIRQPLQEDARRESARVDEKFKEHGERLGALHGTLREHGGRIESVDRQAERLHLQFVSMAEHTGRLETTMGQIQRTLESYHQERVNEDQQLAVGLAEIKAQLASGNSAVAVLDQLKIFLMNLNGDTHRRRE